MNVKIVGLNDSIVLHFNNNKDGDGGGSDVLEMSALMIIVS